MNTDSILQHLNEVNDVPVLSVEDDAFRSYGRIVTGFDFSPLVAFMEARTPIPDAGNIYVASVPEMEEMAVSVAVSRAVYGGMPAEVGYCNGRNTTYNGFEYHKGSELNIAVTDFMLVLGHTWDIRDRHYRNSDAEVFFVPRGTAVEMYQTTLHLSPIRTSEEGFRDIVILPAGTNTPLTTEEQKLRDEAFQAGNKEAGLLLERNKWVIAHPDRKPLIDKGAYPGIIGENKELMC